MLLTKQSLFGIVVLVTCAASYATTYAGRVIDSETGSGLSGVAITLLNSDGKTTTDSQGKFSIVAEVPVVNRMHRFTEGSTMQWLASENAFDLKSAPQVTSLLLSDLKGGQLYYSTRIPGSDKITLPSLSHNVYLLRTGTQGGVFSSVKWVHMGNDAIIHASGTSVPRLAKLSKVVSALVLEKQGYQTKQEDVDSDSTYTSMLIKMKPAIGATVFDDDTIRTYRLYCTESNLATLFDFNKLVTSGNTVNSIIVPGRLEMEGRVLDSVGVRFRGDQSLWDCVASGKRKKNVTYPQFGFGKGDICAKFSMKFDFNRYKKDQRLYGLKALNFRSMSADPTKMREKLGYSLFSDMGIVSPRASYAKLYINDTLFGLFGIAEEIDGRFTKSRYPKTGDGNVYKDLWPETRSTDKIILDALETNNDAEDNPDISDFKAFRDMVMASGTTADNFVEKTGQLVDIPYLVSYIVVDRGIMNFDGIMSCYTWTGGYMRHNFCWYHDDESGLFRLIPWDLDKVLLYPEPNFWTNNAPVGNNIAPNWNVVNATYTNYTCKFDPGSNSSGYKVEPIDKDKFLRCVRSATWNDFHKQGQLFLDSVFTQEKIDKRISSWRKLVAVAVGEDPTIDSAEWVVMVDSMSRTVPLWRKNLEMMIDTLMVK